jgi:hypothetical protein
MSTVTKSATTAFQHDDVVTFDSQVHGHIFKDRMHNLNLAFVIAMTL